MRNYVAFLWFNGEENGIVIDSTMRRDNAVYLQESRYNGIEVTNGFDFESIDNGTLEFAE